MFERYCCDEESAPPPPPGPDVRDEDDATDDGGCCSPRIVDVDVEEVVVVRPRADLAANKFLFLDDDDVDIISYVLLLFLIIQSADIYSVMCIETRRRLLLNEKVPIVV